MCIICVELLIKVLGMGLVPYLRSTWRIFEGSVAVLALLGYIITTRLDNRNKIAPVWARIFTLLRVLSFLKFMLNVPSLRIMLTASKDSVTYIRYILLVALLLVFMYAKIGMTFYSGSFFNQYTLSCAEENVGNCAYIDAGFTKRPM